MAKKDVAPTSQPPGWFDLLLESRAILEWASYYTTRRWFDLTHQGDGHPVLTLPGFLTNDLVTTPLRSFLATAGFTPYPWEQGFNTGPSTEVLKKLRRQVRQLAREHQEKVSLVGWSLGGAMAMAVAATESRHIRSVVTLGSPLTANPQGSSIAGLFEYISGLNASHPQVQKMVKGHPSIPTTSIVTQGDGVVHWEDGRLREHPRGETVGIRAASHLGLPAHPAALWVVADRLRQHPHSWQPFSPPPGLLSKLTHRVEHGPSVTPIPRRPRARPR